MAAYGWVIAGEHPNTVIFIFFGFVWCLSVTDTKKAAM